MGVGRHTSPRSHHGLCAMSDVARGALFLPMLLLLLPRIATCLHPNVTPALFASPAQGYDDYAEAAGPAADALLGCARLAAQWGSQRRLAAYSRQHPAARGAAFSAMSVSAHHPCSCCSRVE